MTQTTPVWKIAATVGGTALTGAAVWLNATHIAHAAHSPLNNQGRQSPCGMPPRPRH